MINLNRGVSTSIALTIIIVLAVVLVGGVAAYNYYYVLEKEPGMLEVKVPEGEIPVDETADWEIYSEEIEPAPNNSEFFSKEYLKENLSACNVDSDCEIVFSSCACKNVCRNVYDEDKRDCARFCSEDESDYSIKNCKCENNQCVSAEI